MHTLRSLSRDGGHWLAVGSFLFISLLLWAGCVVKSDSAGSEDELARASHLIEQKQYSEAIYVLEARSNRSGGDVKTRVLLASAYAARGGIAFTHYSNFASELVKWDKIDEFLPIEDDGSFVQQLAKAAVRLQIAYRAFRAVPVPRTAEAAQDIARGLNALEQVGSLNGGPSLYRALLRIVVFKQKMTSAHGRPKIDSGCMADASEVVAWLKQILRDLELVFLDVAMGLNDPAAKARVLAIAAQLKGAQLDALLKDLLAKAADDPSASRVQIPSVLKRFLGSCQ